jgi:hypothetical protein
VGGQPTEPPPSARCEAGQEEAQGGQRGLGEGQSSAARAQRAGELRCGSEKRVEGVSLKAQVGCRAGLKTPKEGLLVKREEILLKSKKIA